MTPGRFTECLNAMGWSHGMCADRLGISVRTVRSWENGRREIPNNLETWIEELVARVQQKPAGWSRVYTGE
jgi:DNA-binding transcriptional regulator YiaG